MRSFRRRGGEVFRSGTAVVELVVADIVVGVVVDVVGFLARLGRGE